MDNAYQSYILENLSNNNSYQNYTLNQNSNTNINENLYNKLLHDFNKYG